MQYYEISYYRTRNWIDKKYVKSELGSSDAICKTKLKQIHNVEEITEERYNECIAKNKALKSAKAQQKADAFIQ